MGLLLPLSIYFLVSSSLWLLCVGNDRLLPGNPISVNQTVTSPGGTFALGFFYPGNTTGNSYVGIWYNSIPGTTVVWVANREAPLRDPTGVVAVMADGNIALLDGKGRTLWSTSLVGIPSNTSAVLLDSGNLVLRDRDGDDLWQSFDHPTDTWLPAQHLLLDLQTGRGTILVSWKDPQHPSPGNFSLSIDPRSHLQAVVKNGSRIHWRGRAWNGRQVVAIPYTSSSSSMFIQYFTLDKQGFSVTYTATGMLALTRVVIAPSGDLQTLYWNKGENSWSLAAHWPENPCETYEPCGAFGYCELHGSSPLCRCLQGFEPKNKEEWNLGDFSGGCARQLPLAFDRKDKFLKSDYMKLPDNFTVKWHITSGQCDAGCLEDGRCTAYAYTNFTAGTWSSTGSRCLVWSGELIDLARRVDSGEDLHVRVAAASELETDTQEHIHLKKNILPKIIIPTVAGGLLLMVTSCLLLRRIVHAHVRMQKRSKRLLSEKMRTSETLGGENDISELSLLDFDSIVAATNNFSIENQLGQGGFGPVYKGKLFQVHEVAIKRLSKCSGQGFEEFSNEVKLIAKLQHTNLVRLLGWCSHEEEKILIYEYMPKGSLDKIIFNPSRSVELDWEKRVKIIEGIANGILYLHHYSRLRVIHRDLKTSNILLDAAMNPKISDFGLARIFEGNQTEANTKRVVGTYGYMSPEYAMDGLFSEKSDVFSFGVMLLEIITGKRTTGFYPYKGSLNLLGYVWQLWKEGHSLELLDPSVGDTFPAAEVSKCIQVGLLCIQEDASDRPSMSSIVFMLRKENSTLPSPKQPAFAIKKSLSPMLTTGTLNTAQEHGGSEADRGMLKQNSYLHARKQIPLPFYTYNLPAKQRVHKQL